MCNKIKKNSILSDISSLQRPQDDRDTNAQIDNLRTATTTAEPWMKSHKKTLPRYAPRFLCMSEVLVCACDF